MESLPAELEEWDLSDHQEDQFFIFQRSVKRMRELTPALPVTALGQCQPTKLSLMFYVSSSNRYSINKYSEKF